MAHAYPIVLDISDRLIVIVGGGRVAVRKAGGLLEGGARQVRCVAPKFCAELPLQVQRINDVYRPEHLDGAGLVFAATDSALINSAVVRDARARGILACRADIDDQAPGDFATPALLRRGSLTIAVTAASPALSAFIRDCIATAFDPRWEQMADAMSELRPLIRSVGIESSRRREIFRQLASEEALQVLQHTGVGGLLEWLRKDYPELSHA